MSNDLVVFDDQAVAVIKAMFCKTATDIEFTLFMDMAKSMNLDPRRQQIHFVKYGDKYSIIVGINGYRLVADRTGKYMPGREPTFTYDKNGKVISATSYIKKWGPDKQWHEVAATCFLEAYSTGKSRWAIDPAGMLAKCAEKAALVRAFPGEMSGTESDDEMENVIEIATTKPTTRNLEIGSKPVVETLELMGMSQDCELMELVGTDIDYRNRIYSSYSNILKKEVKSFMDIPAREFALIKGRVQAHNAEREKEVK